MNFLLSPYLIGLLSSVVTELLKFFPALKANTLTTVATAVIVMTAGTLWSLGFDVSAWDWKLFGEVFVWSFVNYKVIVAPVAATLDSPTQA